MYGRNILLVSPIRCLPCGLAVLWDDAIIWRGAIRCQAVCAAGGGGIGGVAGVAGLEYDWMGAGWRVARGVAQVCGGVVGRGKWLVGDFRHMLPIYPSPSPHLSPIIPTGPHHAGWARMGESAIRMGESAIRLEGVWLVAIRIPLHPLKVWLVYLFISIIYIYIIIVFRIALSG